MTWVDDIRLYSVASAASGRIRCAHCWRAARWIAVERDQIPALVASYLAADLGAVRVSFRLGPVPVIDAVVVVGLLDRQRRVFLAPGRRFDHWFRLVAGGRQIVPDRVVPVVGMKVV